jgi:predicted TIM-barrel fold metal-dependent hydrolase
MNNKKRIIDCHQHVGFHGYDADKLKDHLDSLGVTQAWLHTWESLDGSIEPSYTHLGIEQVWAACRKYPKLFVPFYAPDPRREDAPRLLEKWIKKGVKGYGEHKVRIKVDNPYSMRMYRLCGEAGLPVLFHLDIPLLDDPVWSKLWYNADIDDFKRVLKECKKTTFIAHGPGWWRYICKDEGRQRNMVYPSGKVKAGGKLPRLLAKYPNVYADISGHSGYNALTRDKGFGIRFIHKFYRKLLYGTDFHDRKHLDYLMNTGFPKKVLNPVLYRNAEKILRKD